MSLIFHSLSYYYSLLLPPAEVNFNNFQFSPSALLLFFFLLASTHTATAAALFLNFFFFPHFLSLIINQFNEAFFLERKKQRSFDVLCISHFFITKFPFCLNIIVWHRERERADEKGHSKKCIISVYRNLFIHPSSYRCGNHRSVAKKGFLDSTREDFSSYPTMFILSLFIIILLINKWWRWLKDTP